MILSLGLGLYKSRKIGNISPIISGTARPGNTLTSTNSGQWYLNGVAVSGQTGSSLFVPYTVAPNDIYTQIGSNSITVVAYDLNAKTDIDAVIAASSDWGDTADRRNWNKWLYSDLISDMKTAGVYASVEFRKCFMGPNTLAGCQACGIGGTITNNGPFVEGDLSPLGTKGNGINKFWRSSKAGNSTAQNDFSVWAWVTEATTVTNNAFFGNGANVAGAVSAIHNTGNNISSAGKTSAQATTLIAGSHLGLVCITRNSSTDYILRVSGINHTISSVSTGNRATIIDWMASDGSRFSQIREGMIGAGSNLNGKESALETCLQNYQNARALVP